MEGIVLGLEAAIHSMISCTAPVLNNLVVTEVVNGVSSVQLQPTSELGAYFYIGFQSSCEPLLVTV